MNTIGTFTKTADGYSGVIRTLTANAKAEIVPAEKKSENAPDYRVLANSFEIGAAWKKTSKENNRPYLSITLDDPSFTAPIYLRLVTGENGVYNLVWSRRNGD